MAIGRRIYLQRNLPEKDIVKAFEGIPAACIADCMERSCALDPSIHLMSKPEKTMVGVALTVKSRAGDNLLVHKALKMAEEGDVIIVSNDGGDRRRAIIGENMASTGVAKNIAGIVFDGPIRDIDGISKLALPIYATGTTPGGPYKDGPGEINVPISCGGISINPGDVIIGDCDGIIVIPKEDASSLIEAARKKMEADEKSLEQSRKNEAKRVWVEKTLDTLEYEIIDGAYENR